MLELKSQQSILEKARWNKMSFRNLLHYLPDFWKGKDMILSILLLIFLSVVVLAGGGKFTLAYQTATEIRQQIIDMNTFLDEYNQKVIQVNQAVYRPVKAEQVDNVQSNILLALQQYKLDLIGFKNVQTEKTEVGKVYELTFQGSWESTVHFIENFHVRDALISIKDMKMSEEKGIVKTVLQYKIYTK